MKEPIKLGLLLFVITSICVGLTGLVYGLTKPVISEQNEKSKQEAMKKIIADADEFIPVENIQDSGIQELYIAQKGGQGIGYVAKVAPEGYAGPVELMVGMDSNVSVVGIQILSHSETPGLGANATGEGFRSQYQGKTPPLNVVKGSGGENDIVAITGATITSAAVTKGVNDAASYIKEHQQELVKGGE